MLVMQTTSEGEVREAYVLDVIAANSAAADERQTAAVFSREQLNQKQLEGFSGERLYYDLGMSLQERQVYKAGALVQVDKITGKNTANPNQILSAGGGTALNREHCVTWWLITTIFYTDGSTEVYEEYLGMTCTTVGGDDRCSIEPASIQGDVSTFEVGLQCGGSGGTDVDVEIIPDKTLLDDPKAKCIFDKLGPGNHAYDKFLIEFQRGTGYNVTFKLKSNLTDSKGKPANGLTEYNLRDPNVTITINSSTLHRTSFEVAGTFVHEMAHAYLAQKLISIGGPGNLQQYTTDTDFKELFDYYSKHVDPLTGAYTADGNSLAQHNLMADKLIFDIALGIKGFVEMDYPIIKNQSEITFEHYKAVAWNGLRETDAYKSLSKEDQSKTISLENMLKSYTASSCKNQDEL